MARRSKKPSKREIDAYMHTDKERVNNPPVGLVTPDTDKDEGKKEYAYDPHIDPSLQWAGKAEHTSFDVPTVSLHVHERIDPKSIIQQVKKKNGSGQPDLFTWSDEVRPLRESIEFYKHKNNWTNRLIAGDSLLVMNSLLEKEGMAGQAQMVYMDPPYGIKYGSNFQPFTNKRSVTDGKDDDLTAEPEMIRAFRDTWELGIHSYLTYMRDRLLMAKELLHETGSCFVQISDENVHHVRELMDEIFGAENFIAQINYKSMSALGQSGLAKVYDYIIWYARDKQKYKFRPLFSDRDITHDKEYRFIDDDAEENGFRRISDEEFQSLKDKNIVFRRSKLTSSGFTPSCTFNFEFQGVNCKPFGKKSWRTNEQGIKTLIEKNRLFLLSNSPYYKQYQGDFPHVQLENSWTDQPPAVSKSYVVETAKKIHSTLHAHVY